MKEGIALLKHSMSVFKLTIGSKIFHVSLGGVLMGSFMLVFIFDPLILKLLFIFNTLTTLTMVVIDE